MCAGYELYILSHDQELEIVLHIHTEVLLAIIVHTLNILMCSLQ